ncbi:MAG: GMC family oxidoreductase, partial [Acidobacteria bacterium]|nr:GMC family oxidoreductase [Acidobacteriota bacterium]
MPQEKYDVIVVGGGAGGGTAAYVLTGLGLKVLLLDGGPKLEPGRDFRTHKMPYDMPFRGFGRPGDFDGLWKINEYTDQLYTHPRREPYATYPDHPFHWTRVRMVGGRTLVWGRASIRHGPLDFKTKSRQGFGEDWPIDYEDLAPYYDKVERLIGVNGSIENVFNAPDGIHLPPLKPRCGELLIRKGAAKLGIRVATTKTAVLTAPHGGRPACHYCGECGRGCDVAARFSSLEVLIPLLLKRKNFTLQTHAAVYQVLPDQNGRARGVSYIDTRTKKDYEVEGRAVVLAASTVESCRILLNSRSRFHPNGFANSSGLVGHYVMDSVKAGPVTAFLPRLRGRPVVNEDGAGGSHVYIPRFNYKRKNNYAGGYVILPGAAFGKSPTGAGTVKGYGASFKRGVRDLYGTAVSLRAYGERLPDYDNYFEIDPSGAKDSLGIPQVKFHCQERDNDRKMMQDMFDWKEQILRACGAEGIRYERYLEPMGDATHECGAARMGNDPKTSVLNRFNQAHEVKNLFVTDASCFVSLPATHGITTWIMA